MNNQTLDNCASCGEQWKTRERAVYDTGAKSIPIISGFQLLSHHGKKRIKLNFCDKHGNNLRQVTRYMNKTGILKIRNVIKNTWRTAEKIGVAV